jgi:hypothetical protein
MEDVRKETALLLEQRYQEKRSRRDAGEALNPMEEIALRLHELYAYAREILGDNDKLPPERCLLELLFLEFWFRTASERRVREFFRDLGPRGDRAEQARRKDYLAVLYVTCGFPPLEQFAADVTAANRLRVREERLGPLTTSYHNMLRYLERMLKEKKYRGIAEARAVVTAGRPLMRKMSRQT